MSRTGNALCRGSPGSRSAGDREGYCTPVASLGWLGRLDARLCLPWAAAPDVDSGAWRVYRSKICLRRAWLRRGYCGGTVLVCTSRGAQARCEGVRSPRSARARGFDGAARSGAVDTLALGLRASGTRWRASADVCLALAPGGLCSAGGYPSRVNARWRWRSRPSGSALLVFRWAGTRTSPRGADVSAAPPRCSSSRWGSLPSGSSQGRAPYAAGLGLRLRSQKKTAPPIGPAAGRPGLVVLARHSRLKRCWREIRAAGVRSSCAALRPGSFVGILREMWRAVTP